MSTSKNISYQPSEGLTYDPTDAKYWQREMLDKEEKNLDSVVGF